MIRKSPYFEANRAKFYQPFALEIQQSNLPVYRSGMLKQQHTESLKNKCHTCANPVTAWAFPEQPSHRIVLETSENPTVCHYCKQLTCQKCLRRCAVCRRLVCGCSHPSEEMFGEFKCTNC